MKETFIKICGLTNPNQAKDCVKLGASAIGVVFFKKSHRNLSKEDAKKICSIIPNHIISTGVFVDATYDFIMERVQFCKLNAVQMHGKESPALVRKIAGNGIKVIKVFFAAKDPGFKKINHYSDIWACITEYGMGKLPGGNAEKWDYNLAGKINSDHKIIIAGGLDTGNVLSALEMSNAFGVDVSSGVESLPGIKEISKVKNFINKIKNFERRHFI